MKPSAFAQHRAVVWAAIGCVLALGLWLRAHDLARSGLALDEIGTAWATRGDSVASSVRRVLAIHGQSPLYYEIVRWFTAALGESVATLRLPSALAGALVPLLSFLGAARLFGKRVGAIALVLAAFHPALIEHARSARPYVLAEAATAASFWGFARAIETGAARDRWLAWGSAVTAVYAHYLFLPIALLLPASVLAVGRAERRYGARALARDGGYALLALVPALVHQALLLARREELAWVERVDVGVFGRVVLSEARVAILVAIGFALARKLRRAPAPPCAVNRPSRERAGVVCAALTVALPVALVLALLALDSNLVADRYLAMSVLGSLWLTAWILVTLPRPIGALALAFVTVGEVRVPPPPAQEWREAVQALRALAPERDQPILLWSWFVESNLVVRSPGLTELQQSFVEFVLEVVPGEPGARALVRDPARATERPRPRGLPCRHRAPGAGTELVLLRVRPPDVTPRSSTVG